MTDDPDILIEKIINHYKIMEESGNKIHVMIDNLVGSDDFFIVVSVLKMVYKQGYPLDDYQSILDDARTLSEYTQEGNSIPINIDDFHDNMRIILDNFIKKYTNGHNNIAANMTSLIQNGTQGKLNMLFRDPENNGIYMVIFGHDDDKSGTISKKSVEGFKSIVENMSLILFNSTDFCNSSFSRIKSAFITKKPLTTAGNNFFESCNGYIFHYLLDSIIIDPCENVFSNYCKVISSSEVKELEKSVGENNINKLPIIAYRKDECYNYHAFPKGSIIEIYKEQLHENELLKSDYLYRKIM